MGCAEGDEIPDKWFQDPPRPHLSSRGCAPWLQLPGNSSPDGWILAAGRLSGPVRHPNVDQLARPDFSAESEATAAELRKRVQAAGRGDALAQTTLVRDYTPRLAGLIRTIVRQPSAIEDLVQITFIKMLRALPYLRDPAVFEPWLFRIARSTALDHLRRQKCRPVMVADEIELMNAAEVRHDEAVTEISEALERALGHLTPKDQRLMRMLVQGHNYHTLASQEGLTVGAVKARICRIRGFLRVAVGTATGTRQASPEELQRRPLIRGVRRAQLVS